MIEHVHRRAGQASTVDLVLVATDDERIADAVDAFGGTAVLTRADHPSGTDRLAEVATGLDCELVVNVQGDEPLIEPAAIDDAVRPLLGRPGDGLSTLRRRIGDPHELADPSVVKVTVDREGYALYFSRSAIPFVRPGAPPATAWRHVGLYVYRPETLRTLAALEPTPLERAEGLEQLRALEHGIRILTVETTTDALSVDTPEDLERVRRRVEAARTPS